MVPACAGGAVSESQRKTDLKLTVDDLRKIREHARRTALRREWWGRFWWWASWAMLMVSFVVIVWAMSQRG